MARVAHDRHAYGQRSGGLLVVQRNTRLYLLEPNGELDRADDVDGTDAGELAAFLAGETLADGYTLEVGGSAISYPLVADSHGKWPVTWHAPGSYDEYCPDDPVNPIRRFEAVSGRDLGGRELVYAERATAVPGVTGLTHTTITGLDAVTFTMGERPVLVEFHAAVYNGTAGQSSLIVIYEGADELMRQSVTSGSANMIAVNYLRRRIAPGETVGVVDFDEGSSHTLTAKLAASSAGSTANVLAGTAGARAILTVTEK